MDDLVIHGPDVNSSTWLPPNIPVGNYLYTLLKERKGDDVIVVDEHTKETFTYRDILDKTLKLAIALRRLGVKKDDVVTIISENNVSCILAILSCFYAGATCYPLNPAYSPREIKHALDITKPKVAFISDSVCKSLNKISSELGYLEKIVVFGESRYGYESFESLLVVSDEEMENFQFETYDLKSQRLLILSSSGTTGLPKSVVITHENFRLSCVYLRDPDYLGLSYEDKVVLILPLFHIFGLFLSIASILYGAKLIMLPKFKPDLLLGTIETHKITKLVIVPTLAVLLAKSPIVDNYDLTSVKDIFCGAAYLGNEIQTALQNKFKIKVRQVYGMSETCGGVTISRFDKITALGSVGEVVPGVSAKIVDVITGAKLGPNKVGEICCKSGLNFKGYFNDDIATTEIYDAEGFLHTGDTGYYDENKFFFIVDRLKDLIKYKGFQVPPTELENILLSHDGIKEAAVVGIPDEKAGELPLAFVIRKEGFSITEDEVKSFVAESVSIQKQLHGGVRFVDEIPKGPSGKTLRRKLRELVLRESKLL